MTDSLTLPLGFVVHRVDSLNHGPAEFVSNTDFDRPHLISERQWQFLIECVRGSSTGSNPHEAIHAPCKGVNETVTPSARSSPSTTRMTAAAIRSFLSRGVCTVSRPFIHTRDQRRAAQLRKRLRETWTRIETSMKSGE